MKLRKLFAWLMTLVMLLGMVPAAQAELCSHQYDWRYPDGMPTNCQDERLCEMYCTICGEVVSSYPNRGEHTPTSWYWDGDPPSNCQDRGIQIMDCARCGETYTEREIYGSHSWGAFITMEAATCETAGWKASYCTVCGDRGETQEIPALGHDWGSWSWAHGSAPSCTEGAWQVRDCQRCGRMEDRYVQGSDHKFGEWITTEEPTCTERGRHHHKCTVCGYSEWEPIPTVDHIWGDWRVIEEPQVGIPGTERRACTFGCGLHEDREIPPLEETLSAEGLELTLVLTSTPANGEYFVVGEEVVFTENWVNNSDKTLYPFSVSIFTCAAPEYGSEVDQIGSWFAEDAGGPVAPGATGSHTLTVTVTEADVARGSIYAMAELLSTVQDGPDLENVTTPYVTAPCAPVAGSDYTTSIKLEVLDIPSVTAEWAGDVYPVKVKVTNTGDTTISLYAHRFSDSNNDYYPNAILYDWNKYQDTPRATWLPAGESLTTDIEFAVTQDGIAAGELRFSFTQFATPRYVVVNDVETNIPAEIVAEPEGTTGYYDKRDEEVTDTVEIVVPINQGTPDLPELHCAIEVANTPANGTHFVPGEEIRFTVSFTNPDNCDLTEVTLLGNISDIPEHKGGQTLHEYRLANLVPLLEAQYTTGSFNFSYTATADDAARGAVYAEAAYWACTTEGIPCWEYICPRITVPCGPGEDEQSMLSLTMAPKYEWGPENGSHYVLGESPWTDWTLHNNSDTVTMTLTDVKCYLNGYLFKYWENSNSTRVLTPGGDYVDYDNWGYVDPAEVEQGYMSVMIMVECTGDDGKTYTAEAELQLPCGPGEPLPAVALTKSITSTPANGEYYVPGERIDYDLLYEAFGPGETVSSEAYTTWWPTLYDPLTSKNEDGLVSRSHFAQSFMFLYPVHYTVTEDDAARGYVDNTAFVRFSYTEGGDICRVDSNTVTAPCGFGELPEGYEPQAPDTDGDGIPNDKDPDIDGDGVPNGSDPDIDGDGIPNESDPDVDGDGIPNGEDPDVDGDGVPNGSDPDIDGDGIPNESDPDMDGDGIPNESDPDIDGDGIPNEEDPTPNGVVAEVTIVKGIRNNPANGQFFVPGEVIEFVITAQNGLGQTVDTVVITDPLSAEFYFESETIPAGQSATATLSYTVTELDAAIGSVSNYAYAVVYVAGQPQSLISNTVTADCGFAAGDDPFGVLSGLEITKAVESLPANGLYYAEGEKIAYAITVVNSGETRLGETLVYDALYGMVEMGTAEFLEPGESRTYRFSYTVTADDVARGYVYNQAMATYDLNGYTNTVLSNEVVTDTDGNADPVPGTPEWPIFTPVVPGSNGISGAGNDHCVTTLTGWNANSISARTVFCPDHAATQDTIAIMMSAATDEASQQRVHEYAISLWQADLERMYSAMIAASDPAARVYLINEYVQFFAWAGNYSTALTVFCPDQPALVARLVAQAWQDKCIGLCGEAGSAPAQPTDSLFLMEQGADAHAAPAAGCALECTAETGAMACTDVFCKDHSFLFGMTSALLRGENTAASWGRIAQMWQTEVNKAYNALYAAAGEDGKAAVIIERNVFENWLVAREAQLTVLYPENPEIVAEILTREIITHVSDLCEVIR